MSEIKEYEVVVIGGGPGGYVAALACAQHGMRTACVDSWLSEQGKPCLGGTCLNAGCIPSKALLDSSHHFLNANKEMAVHGIVADNIKLDLQVMMRRKDKIVNNLRAGISHLVQKSGVDWVRGHARLAPNREVEVTQMGELAGEQLRLKADKIIIATGSIPTSLPCAVANHHNIVDSTSALRLESVPAKLGVIGGGVIGMELGSVWNRLGSEVTILEGLPALLPGADADIAKTAEKMLRNQGIDFQLAAKVEKSNDNGKQVTVSWRDQNGAVTESLFDKLIVATGRSPNTSGLGASTLGIEQDQKGFIVIDHNWRTNVEGIYAIGDVTPGPMLAHRASADGHRLADSLAGNIRPQVDGGTVPWVIYTWPEIAWVGAKQSSSNKSGSFPMRASGRARCMNEPEGMIKLVSDPNSGRLLGAHIIAANASELIAEAVAAIELQATVEDLAHIVHAHPTLAEGFHEAALSILGKPLHG